MDEKDKTDVELNGDLDENVKVKIIDKSSAEEKPAGTSTPGGIESNQVIGLLPSLLLDSCGVDAEREITTSGSQGLNSVLEYTNKIRAFVGLEDDSSIPVLISEVIPDEPDVCLVENEKGVEMENLFQHEFCDVDTPNPDQCLLDEEVRSGDENYVIGTPTVTAFSLKEGIEEIDGTVDSIEAISNPELSSQKIGETNLAFVNEKDECADHITNESKEMLTSKENITRENNNYEQVASLEDDSSTPAPISAKVFDELVDNLIEKVNSCIDMDDSTKDGLFDKDTSEPDRFLLDKDNFPRDGKQFMESPTILSLKGEIEKVKDPIELKEEKRDQGQSSNLNDENNFAFVNEKDDSLALINTESEVSSNNEIKPCEDDIEKVPSIAALRRLSVEIVNKVLDSAGSQLNGMLGDPEKSNVKLAELNSCVTNSENAMKNSDLYINNPLEIDKSVSKAIENNKSSTDNLANKLKNEINLKDVLSKTYDSKDFRNKIEFEMNKFDPSYDIDPDTICGIGSFKPQWLQKWATARVYLLVYAIIGILSGSYYTYFIGTISTLEKRFAFKSKVSGSIMMLDEITPLLLGMLVGYFGGKVHRPRMVGISMLMASCSCFVSALPYFIYGPATHLNTFNVKNTTELEMCESSVRVEECDSDDRPPTLAAILFLMLGSFLKGFGNLAYYAVGLAYMDDNAKKKNTPMYFAVVFALRLLGPLVGFLMSSAFLKYPENPFEDPGFGSDDPRWIGGWWIGFMLQGVLLTIFSTPMLLFPRKLPGHKIVRRSSKELAETGLLSNIGGMFTALKRLAKNPLYIFITLNTIMSVFGSFGHYVMLPKYMENQFRLSASEASLLSGPPGLAAIIVSTLVGGYLIYKFKPNAKVLTAGMCISEIIAVIGFLILMIPQCEKVEMTNYGWSGEALILDGDCNNNCHCTTKSFTPVCAPDGKTHYFSPCYPGCQERVNQTFTNCSCFDTSNDLQQDHFTKGFCVNEDCWSAALAYIITLPILQTLVSVLRVAHTMVLLRSIKPEDKSVALGTFEAFLSTFAFIPFPIVFGSIVDSVCLVWEKSCGQTGNCWFYDVPKFNYLLHGASALFSGFSAICLFVIFCLSGRVNDLYNDDEDEEIDGTQKEVHKNQQDSENSVTKF